MISMVHIRASQKRKVDVNSFVIFSIGVLCMVDLAYLRLLPENGVLLVRIQLQWGALVLGKCSWGVSLKACHLLLPMISGKEGPRSITQLVIE